MRTAAGRGHAAAPAGLPTAKWGGRKPGRASLPFGATLRGSPAGAGEGGSAPFDPLERPRSGRPWRALARQVARIGGNLNHLGAVSGLVERRRRPHWDDLPSHLAGEKPRPAAGFVDTPRSQRRLMAFPMPIEASNPGGRSLLRPRAPERRRRSGGRAATVRQPATYGSAVAHMESAIPCTCTPISNVHTPISTHPRRSAFKIRLQGAVSCAVSLRPSVIVPALENRWRSFNSTIRLRQACRSPYSPSTRVTRLTDGLPGPGGLAADRLVG